MSLSLFSVSAWSARTLFSNGKIYDGTKFIDSDSMLVQDGRFLAIGLGKDLRAQLKPDDQEIDLEQARVLPGFIESHAHLLGIGQALLNLDLRGLSPQEILALVKAQAKKQGPDSWIKGRGWDQNLWPSQEFPTTIMLSADEIKQPVYLRRVDGHAVWLNQRALDLAGISRETADPEGGEIIRDQHGHPTGVLIDNAMSLASKHMAQPSPAELEHYLDLGAKQALSMGITSFHDAGVSREGLKLFEQKARDQQLNLRIYAMIDGEDPDLVKSYLARGPQNISDFLSIRSIKYFADGALGSRGALLLEDYHDQPGHRGLALISRDDLAQKTAHALQAGFQVSTHAIGDQANRLVLDAYAQALAQQEPGDYRLRLEHAQLIDPKDQERFKNMGIIASMQPIHCTSDMAWVPDRLGPDRIKNRAYPWRSLLDLGVNLAFGSDAPVEDLNPIKGLYAAVTRSAETGSLADSFMPEQKLNLKQALAGYFQGAAWAEFNEQQKGLIAPGYWADFVVFEQDILQLAKTAFLAAQAKITVVGGKIVYEREHQ